MLRRDLRPRPRNRQETSGLTGPFHSMVSKTLNRTGTSWDRASACVRSEALCELACCAPHAPDESQSHFVFRELRTKIRRTTSDHDALEIPAQLRLQSSANDPLYRRTRATTSQASQHTIVLHRLVEPSILPSAAAERPRLDATGSHEITPLRR